MLAKKLKVSNFDYFFEDRSNILRFSYLKLLPKDWKNKSKNELCFRLIEACGYNLQNLPQKKDRVFFGFLRIYEGNDLFYVICTMKTTYLYNRI